MKVSRRETEYIYVKEREESGAACLQGVEVEKGT